MHLIELTDNNTCIAFSAEESTADDDVEKIQISAVKFRGWITSDGKIKDRVNIYDSFCVEVRSCRNSSRDLGKKENKHEKTESREVISGLLKLKEYVGDGIVIAYSAGATIGFFARLKDKYGISFKNRVLGISDIARNNYNDKIKDYSFDALAKRFCPGSKYDETLQKAYTTAEIFGQLALEDDFAHCGY